uniref:Uncharacterized protein n=1 Tax=Anguilla anguilla TaxID=7936 RepID=A0A0E9TJ37_ANGAN
MMMTNGGEIRILGSQSGI